MTVMECTYIHTYMRVHTNKRIHIHAHSYIHTLTQVYTHIHIHMHTLTHVHTHTHTLSYLSVVKLQIIVLSSDVVSFVFPSLILDLAPKVLNYVS